MTTVNVNNCGVASALAIVQLQKLKPLFQNDDAYRSFVNVLREATEPGTIAVVLDDESPICGLVSTQDTQKALRGRIVVRLTQDPKALQEISKGLQDEGFVQHGELT